MDGQGGPEKSQEEDVQALAGQLGRLERCPDRPKLQVWAHTGIKQMNA